jgi:hypothetical protein
MNHDSADSEAIDDLTLLRDAHEADFEMHMICANIIDTTEEQARSLLFRRFRISIFHSLEREQSSQTSGSGRLTLGYLGQINESLGMNIQADVFL